MSTLKSIRETLCVAQTALARMADQAPSHEIGMHMGLIDGMIAEIDRHRPLGPDGVHGDLHTPTCGCEDVMMAGSWARTFCAPSKTIEELADEAAGQPDWAKHEIDPQCGPPWPLWAGAEPIDPPDPTCVCGAPWDSESDQCVMYAATRAALFLEVDAMDGRLIAAAGAAVTMLRGLRSLDPAARELIAAWDARQAERTPDEQAYGTVTRQIADMLEQAWNIIANVGIHVHTGGWDAQHPSWVDAAKRWRDERYHPWLSYYCAVTAGMPPNVAWGQARWLNGGRAGVQSQMVTSPHPPKIYMLVSPDSGLYGTYVDGELAHRIAKGLGIAVVEIPITVDYRGEAT